MDKIFGEFMLQVIRLVFFIAVIVCAVKLGIFMAKNKKAKENADQ